MNNEIKNEKEREVHIEQSAKKEDVLSEQERDKKLAGTLAGKKPPTESDKNSGKDVGKKPPETDNPEGKPEIPKNPEEKVVSAEERDAAIAGKLAEQKPPQESDNDSGKDEGDKPPPTDNPESKGQPQNPPKTDVHTEQTKTETQLEKLATAKVGQEVKKTGIETGGESNPDKPPADTFNAIVKGTEVQQTEAKGENKPPDTENVKQKESSLNREAECWKEQGAICKNAYETASATPEKNIYGNDYKELTAQEKQQLSNFCKDHINSVEKGERGDYRVPEPEKIKGLEQKPDGSIRIVEAWKPNTDGAKEGTRWMEVIKAKDENGNPTYIDRIGSNNGNYFSPMKQDGTPYSLKERAIGDYLPEKKLEDNDSYHKYEVKQDLTRENFEAAIENTYKDRDTDAFEEMMDRLDQYYQDASKSVNTINHEGEPYKYIGDCIDGVK